ncbi:MAG TPA: hypothetical protein VFZ37_21895 [Jiangellaceae bacterium]
MRVALRTFPAVLLCAVLTLSACGGSDDADPSADVGSTTTGSGPALPEQATADESEWVELTDEPSGIRFKMPEPTEPQADSATMPDGTPVTLRQYSLLTERDVELGVNVIDTPGTDYDFDAGIDGVAGTLDGEVISTAETEVGGDPAVDVEISYGEGYIVFFRLVTGEEHIVQSLASGPESERAAVRRTHRRLSESVAGH